MRFSLTSVSALLCATMAACGPRADVSGETPQDSVVAFVDVLVVPMDRERILEGQTVVVRGDRIEAMGPAGEMEVPAGAVRIEGGGYLMPGLVDMHAHVDHDSDLVSFLANGVTTVRNMHGGTEYLERRERVARGELPGPTMYTAGPIIDGPAELWPGNASPPLAPEDYKVIETRADGERLAREQAAAGYDFIKVYDNLPAEAYEGIAEAARELGVPVAGHVPFGVGLSRALESRLASIEHLRGYIYAMVSDEAEASLGWDKRSRFLAWNHVDTAKLQRAAAATAEAGVWNVPTLTRYQKNMMPTEEHLARYMSPEASYLDPRIARRMIIRRHPDDEGRYGAFSDADFEAGRSVFESKKAMVRALHEAGAGILLGSDDWFGGFATHQELRNLVAAGLTPYEALTAGTADAAVFLGAKDIFGTVSVGKRADLVLVEGNPLEDVRHAQDPAGVMIRGSWLPESELHQMLDELAASYEATPPSRGTESGSGM